MIGLTNTLGDAMTDTLLPNQSLTPGGVLISTDGKHHLVFQGDGNVVIYNAENKATWATNTVNGTGDTGTSTLFVMQGDGNLVLYGEVLEGPPVGKPKQPPVLVRTVRWNSQTANHPGAFLVMQSDGNLVIYDQGKALWNSRTAGK